MNFKKTTLPNGLRIITVPVKNNPAVTVLVMVETGSNYETKTENGLSHFLEHMCFKGTVKRPKVTDIAKELDSLGAQNNAFTSNEFTGYYAKAAKKHFSKLFEIISDLYLNPTLPADDIEKERGVILEEINMYEDLPQRKVGYVLSELMYGDVPAGRSTLGPPANIKRFTRSDFVNYRSRHYVASKTIVIVAGDVSGKAVLNEVKKRFKDVSTDKTLSKPAVKEKQKSPGLLVHEKKTDQAHIILAFRSYSAKDKRIPALTLLAEIFVSNDELQKAKEHYVGHLYLGLETTDSVAEFYAVQEIIAGKLKNPQELEKNIRKVTAKDVMRVAKDIFRDDKLNLAIVGSIMDKKALKKVLSFK